MIVRISWSGGKDSTAACILHLCEGDMCKIVCYVPMLYDNIPLISKAHYEHIIRTADKFRKIGADVHIISGITYYDHVHTIISRGKNKGLYRGVGLGFGFCQFRDYSKIKSLDNCNVGYFDCVDIGIAADEIKRQSQLTDKMRSILVEKNLTESDAKQICIENDCLSPIYNTRGRDGCAICPNATSDVLLQYIRDYPEAEEILMDIEDFCKANRPEYAPYRNKQWFSDRIKDT